MLDDALTARIAATKRRLLDGGLLQEVEWGVPSGERDERGRVTITYTPLDALIEQRPALDRGTLDTDRADNTVLTILDPLAITDEHTVSMGRSASRLLGQSRRWDCPGRGNRHAIRLRSHRDPVAENGESMAGEPSLFLVYQDFNADERTNGSWHGTQAAADVAANDGRLRLHRPPGRGRGPARMGNRMDLSPGRWHLAHARPARPRRPGEAQVRRTRPTGRAGRNPIGGGVDGLV